MRLEATAADALNFAIQHLVIGGVAQQSVVIASFSCGKVAWGRLTVPGALGMLCEDLIVCCRGGALLCAKATVQQNNEIEAVTVSNCGMFELLNRILRLVRSVTHVKLNDAGTEGRVR